MREATSKNVGGPVRQLGCETIRVRFSRMAGGNHPARILPIGRGPVDDGLSTAIGSVRTTLNHRVRPRCSRRVHPEQKAFAFERFWSRIPAFFCRSAWFRGAFSSGKAACLPGTRAGKPRDVIHLAACTTLQGRNSRAEPLYRSRFRVARRNRVAQSVGALVHQRRTRIIQRIRSATKKKDHTGRDPKDRRARSCPFLGSRSFWRYQ